MPQVHLGILPTSARRYTPFCSFWITEDRYVEIETFSAIIRIDQPREIAIYARVFDHNACCGANWTLSPPRSKTGARSGPAAHAVTDQTRERLRQELIKAFSHRTRHDLRWIMHYARTELQRPGARDYPLRYDYLTMAFGLAVTELNRRRDEDRKAGELGSVTRTVNTTPA